MDNADGTISDSNTGLMWEKKMQATGVATVCTDETGTCADPHNADNKNNWTDGPCCAETDYDGTIVTIFFEQLNNRCDKDTTVSCTANADCSIPTGACGFAGHRDWRLPNIKELQGIIDWSASSPALDVAFHGANCGLACDDLADPACSCDTSSDNWSATTVTFDPRYAWLIYTGDGGVFFGSFKASSRYVRAVRG